MINYIFCIVTWIGVTFLMEWIDDKWYGDIFTTTEVLILSILMIILKGVCKIPKEDK